MQLLAMLGLEGDARPYRVSPSPEAQARAGDLLAQRGFDAAAPDRPRLVGIQAGCHYSRFPEWLLRRVGLRHKFHKAWPYAGWSQVGSLLAAELGARVVLTGVRGERSLAQGIAAAIRAPAGLEPIVAAGDTDVATLIALVARTDLFLSIDTGPMHLAAALGIPTVGLFGPTNPRHHGPWGEPGRSVVLRTGIACSPCAKPVRRACPVNACLTELSPRRVFEAGRDLLEAARPA
jgi:ADP-heptose:LPS heptosyltransferase